MSKPIYITASIDEKYFDDGIYQGEPITEVKTTLWVVRGDKLLYEKFMLSFKEDGDQPRLGLVYLCKDAVKILKKYENKS